MTHERRKESRVRRRLRVSLESVETTDRRATGQTANLSERGLMVTLDPPPRVGTRLVVVALLPGGRVTFDAVVRHAARAHDGTCRAGLEITGTPPAEWRRFVREELAMLLARSGGADAGDVPPAPAGRLRARPGIPSPLSLRVPVEPIPAPSAPKRRSTPQGAAVPIGRLRPPSGARTRKATPRSAGRPRTPSRGAQKLAGPLARLEPGLHGIASAKSTDALDAVVVAAVVRDAVANAIEDLVPKGARLTIVALDVSIEDDADEAGGALAAAVRLEEVTASRATARFVAEVTRRGRTVASGSVRVRIGT